MPLMVIGKLVYSAHQLGAEIFHLGKADAEAHEGVTLEGS